LKIQAWVSIPCHDVVERNERTITTRGPSVSQGDDLVKICIFGAGAIGGYLAVELSLAGHDVCAIARGAHLKAIQQHGLKLLTEGHSKIARIEASDDPRTFGPQES
jgi:Ketopantoate reductase PanE/ApbA